MNACPAELNFASHLAALNAPRAAKLAYIDDTRQLTYGELAERVAREAGTDEDRVRLAFELCYGRGPDAAEAKLVAAFLERGQKLAGGDEKLRAQLLANSCQALLAAAEFRNLD